MHTYIHVFAHTCIYLHQHPYMYSYILSCTLYIGYRCKKVNISIRVQSLELETMILLFLIFKYFKEISHKKESSWFRLCCHLVVIFLFFFFNFVSYRHVFMGNNFLSSVELIMLWYVTSSDDQNTVRSFLVMQCNKDNWPGDIVVEIKKLNKIK